MATDSTLQKIADNLLAQFDKTLLDNSTDFSSCDQILNAAPSEHKGGLESLYCDLLLDALISGYYRYSEMDTKQLVDDPLYTKFKKMVYGLDRSDPYNLLYYAIIDLVSGKKENVLQYLSAYLDEKIKSLKTESGIFTAEDFTYILVVPLKEGFPGMWSAIGRMLDRDDVDSHYEKLDGVESCIDDEIPFEIPDTWAWSRLGSLVEVITSGSRDWAKHYSEKGSLFLRMGNLSRNSFELRLNSLKRVQLPEKAEGTRTALQAGDLLFSITGEVGMLGLIPDDFETAYINQHTAMIRFLPLIRNKYLPYFLLTDYAQKCYKSNQHGIKNSFRLDSISNILVPIPPLSEQEQIIRRIEQATNRIATM